ncbi:MAG: hypothetical protein JRE23_12550 [Deltaproteobacteria bacterium]|nr:hypothetical protein [Deltaproteobacteria bacterium]
MRKIEVGTDVMLIKGVVSSARKGIVVAIVKNGRARQYIVQFRNPACWACYLREELV